MEDEHDKFYDVLDALRAYRKENGKDAATRLVQKVTGETDLNKVPRSKYAEVIKATRSNGNKPGEQVTSSAKWKAVQKATKHGHAKIHGMKSAT